MQENKITLYSSNGTPKKEISEELLGADIIFPETINTGQGEIQLKIKDKFYTDFYEKGDILEIQLFNDRYKNGLNRYSGEVKGLKRTLSAEGEFIDLVVYGIFNFMNDIEKEKNYSGNLNDVIDEFIDDLGDENTIANSTTILGLKKIKNGITSTDSVDYDATGNMMSSLVGIFDSVGIDFFIKADGTIVEGDDDIIPITAGVGGVEIFIDEVLETEIKIPNTLIDDFYPTKKIVLNNVPKNVNLEGQVIRGIDYTDLETTLLLGKILRL